MRQNRSTVDVELVLDRDIVTKDGDIFDSTLDEERDLSMQRFQENEMRRTHLPTVLFQPTMELMIQA